MRLTIESLKILKIRELLLTANSPNLSDLGELVLTANSPNLSDLIIWRVAVYG